MVLLLLCFFCGYAHARASRAQEGGELRRRMVQEVDVNYAEALVGATFETERLEHTGEAALETCARLDYLLERRLQHRPQTAHGAAPGSRRAPASRGTS